MPGQPAGRWTIVDAPIPATFEIHADAYGRITYVNLPLARPVQKSQAEIDADRQRQRVWREQREREAVERRDRAKAADNRAKELLTRLLTPDQRATSDKGFFDVTAASGRTYRVECNRDSYSGNVFWVEGSDVKGSFCIYPTPLRNGGTAPLPMHDAFLGQLLLITCDEDKFLKTGVFHGPVHPIFGPLPHSTYYGIHDEMYRARYRGRPW